MASGSQKDSEAIFDFQTESKRFPLGSRALNASIPFPSSTLKR